MRDANEAEQKLVIIIIASTKGYTRITGIIDNRENDNNYYNRKNELFRGNKGFPGLPEGIRTFLFCVLTISGTVVFRPLFDSKSCLFRKKNLVFRKEKHILRKETLVSRKELL